MRALRALLISDGRPGHYRLSEGILAAIARKRYVETNRFVVRRRFWVPARVMAGLVNNSMTPSSVLKTIYGVDACDVPDCDVVVSAGGNTLGANVAMSRLKNVPNIFYGSLRRFCAEDFALAMTSYVSQVFGPNQLMTLKPSAVDPDQFDRVPGDEGARSLPSMIGLIIGGDAGTVRYTHKDWDGLIEIVGQIHDRFGSRWIVSNSARTPDLVSERFAAACRDAPSGAITSFIDVRKPNSRNLDTLFSRCSVVVCTADSSSMISESVWARRKVLAVMPKRFSLPENEQTYRDWLRENGWIGELTIEALDADSFLNFDGVLGILEDVLPIDTNPLDRLSAEIQQRLPVLFQNG